MLKDFDRNFRDVAKCTFVTDDDVAYIRASRPSGDVLDARNAAIREDSFQAYDHVFNTTVKG